MLSLFLLLILILEKELVLTFLEKVMDFLEEINLLFSTEPFSVSIAYGFLNSWRCHHFDF